MPPRSKTATSTPRLSEFARHFSYPSGIVKTVWTRVEAKGVELGLGFDWWQSQLGMVCLGYGPDGKYVATVGGIGLSIPRQVGKTYFVLATLVIMCVLFPGLQVVWTAHHLRTSTKTFTTLRGICRRRKVAPHIRALRSANGEQQAEFVNGSMIMFGSRKMGFGRGFDEVDIEVFDEAQILDTKSLEDMVAATNQARHEHGALLFFMGTPPKPSDPSEAFTERRAEAHAGNVDDDAIWLEIGADPKSDVNDRAQYPLMNPSFPKRTPIESLLRLRKNLKNDDSWNREGRGVWDDDNTGGALSAAIWAELADIGADRGGSVVFGLDITEDQQAWISVGWVREDGHRQVELANDGQPIPAHLAIAECKRLAAQWGGPVAARKSLEAELLREGVEVIPVTSADFAIACGALDRDIRARSIRHLNQPALNDSVKAVKWRSAGTQSEQAFQLKDSPEAGPVASVTRALHGLNPNTKRPQVHTWPEEAE